MKATGLTAVFTWLLKIVTLLKFLIGLGFIIFGALVTVGVLTIVASILGYAGSQFKPGLLLAYLIIGAVGSVAQLIIVLAIFFAQAEVANAIENMNTQGSVTAAYIREKDREFIVEKLEIGKWIFLWVVLGEAASLAVALVMRLMGKLEGKYENLELEEANRLHDMELQSISNSMTSSQKVSTRADDRLAAKMQKKYGNSGGIDFMQGRRWYNFG